MTHKHKFPKGTVIEFTAGQYSDFRGIGILVTVNDVDLVDLGEEYKAEFVPEYEWEKPSDTGFPAWLVAKGHAMPVQSHIVHCGYDNFELE